MGIGECHSLALSCLQPGTTPWLCRIETYMCSCVSGLKVSRQSCLSP